MNSMKENKYVVPGKARRSPTITKSSGVVFGLCNVKGCQEQPLDLSSPMKSREPSRVLKDNQGQNIDKDSLQSFNAPLQFCGDEEDEVFFGEVTEVERKKAKKFHKRRTVVFLPGFRKNTNLMRRTIDQANKSLREEHNTSCNSQALDTSCDDQALDLRTSKAVLSDGTSNCNIDRYCNMTTDSSLNSNKSMQTSVYNYSRISGVEPLDLCCQSLSVTDQCSTMNNVMCHSVSDNAMCHSVNDNVMCHSVSDSQITENTMNNAMCHSFNDNVMCHSVSDSQITENTVSGLPSQLYHPTSENIDCPEDAHTTCYNALSAHTHITLNCAMNSVVDGEDQITFNHAMNSTIEDSRSTLNNALGSLDEEHSIFNHAMNSTIEDSHSTLNNALGSLAEEHSIFNHAMNSTIEDSHSTLNNALGSLAEEHSINNHAMNSLVDNSDSDLSCDVAASATECEKTGAVCHGNVTLGSHPTSGLLQFNSSSNSKEEGSDATSGRSSEGGVQQTQFDHQVTDIATCGEKSASYERVDAVSEDKFSGLNQACSDTAGEINIDNVFIEGHDLSVCDDTLQPSPSSGSYQTLATSELNSNIVCLASPPLQTEPVSPQTEVQCLRPQVEHLNLTPSKFSAFSTYTPTKQTDHLEPHNLCSPLESITMATSTPPQCQYFPTLDQSDSPIFAVLSQTQPNYFGSLSPFKKDDPSSMFSPFDRQHANQQVSETVTPQELAENQNKDTGSCMTHSNVKPSNEEFTESERWVMHRDDVSCDSSVVTRQPLSFNAFSSHDDASNPVCKPLIGPKPSVWTDQLKKNNTLCETTTSTDYTVSEMATSTDNTVCEMTTSVDNLALQCEQNDTTIQRHDHQDPGVKPSSQDTDCLPVDGVHHALMPSLTTPTSNVCSKTETGALKNANISSEDYARILEAKKVQLQKLREQRERLQEKLRKDRKYGKLSQLHSPKPKQKEPATEYPKIPQVLPRSACVGRPALTLNQKELDAVTSLHTICNSKHVSSVMGMPGSPRRTVTTPVHKPKIKWREGLVEGTHSKYSPSKAEQRQGRSILTQKSVVRACKIGPTMSPGVVRSLQRTNTLS